jgi:alanine racemase
VSARAWADVSLDAVAANVETLRAVSAPAALCAVVKADGYGHGAVPVAQAAVDDGASWLAVAQVDEATALRASGVSVPILLLSEPPLADVEAAVDAGLVVTAYTEAFVRGLGSAARTAAQPVSVHLKVDTGMHRVGAAPEDIVALAEGLHADPHLSFDGMWTHCAVADEPDDPFTSVQLERFDTAVAAVEAEGIPVPLRHAANSAAAIAHPASRYDLVRCGIAVYGIAPAPAMVDCVALEPALRLTTEVAFVKRLEAGERVSYGRVHAVDRDTTVATLPIGYADGVPRRLGLERQPVLIRGRRHPMIGVVTMDQVLVDVGPDSEVAVGDEVVLLGPQGGDRIGPDDWAARLGTIAYEIVCGLGARVERRHGGS